MTSNVKSLVYKMNIVVDCKDAGVLAEFYSKLLGWELTHQRANGWAAITSPSGMVMAFQEIEGKQGQMLHLDFYVENLEEAVVYAIQLGARQADEQYFRTSRTMFDPAGHPFCLDTEEAE